MKNDLPCNLIRDLLPIYHDAATSPESNEIIEAHLKNCSECGNFLQKIRESSYKLLDEEDETNRYKLIGKRIKKRKRIVAVTVVFLFFFALFFLYSTFCPVLVSGDCMSPAITDGQVLYLNRFAYAAVTPKRLDVVAYQQNKSIKIGRIIAFPNEVVSITDGTVYVNGAAMAYPVLPKNLSRNAFTIKKDEYFIIRDSRENFISDKQSVPANSIIGKFHTKG